MRCDVIVLFDLELQNLHDEQYIDILNLLLGDFWHTKYFKPNITHCYKLYLKCVNFKHQNFDLRYIDFFKKS